MNDIKLIFPEIDFKEEIESFIDECKKSSSNIYGLNGLELEQYLVKKSEGL